MEKSWTKEVVEVKYPLKYPSLLLGRDDGERGCGEEGTTHTSETFLSVALHYHCSNSNGIITRGHLTHFGSVNILQLHRGLLYN